ncbi:MAG TPA: RNA polymerase sigma factor [Acidimicrobiales bacterium]|jgi:RNA polymerase sigma-70 factor (ECF subfamily)
MVEQPPGIEQPTRAGSGRVAGPGARLRPRPRRSATDGGAPGEPGGPSDEALLAGMAVRDHGAAATFVTRYQRRVYGLAVTMLTDRSLAEDVAQEAFVRAWKHAPVFDARRGSAATWVLTITRNLAIDALRQRRAVPTDPDVVAALAGAGTDRPTDELVAAGSLSEQVRKAIAALPVEQRRALVLAAVLGRSAAEISTSESIPLGTAKTRIRAALLKLRTALDDPGSDP